MTGARVYPSVVALLAVLLAASCGSKEQSDVAPAAMPRTMTLGWVERSDSPPFEYRVERLVVRKDGWSADVSVSNGSEDDFQIRRPHRPRGALFGLVLLETTDQKELVELTAGQRKEPPFLEPDHIDPPLPGSLRAGEAWRGTIGGSTVLRRGAVVRVIFGRFTRDRSPQVITWVTNHAVRL